MKKQVIVIHGGEIHKSNKDYLKFLLNFKFSRSRLLRQGWSNYLNKELGNKYEVFLPNMLNSYNAKYSEWKIWFERLMLFCNKEVILIGTSLGGLFLIKYLSENRLNKKIKGLFMVAAPFGDSERHQKYTLANFSFKRNNFEKLTKQCKNIYFYHSKDDDNVPIVDFEKYKKYFNDSAKFYEFKNRGHFSIKKFPEIIKDIKNLK
jgi:predicted alpha/beta hydrolase family esterase